MGDVCEVATTHIDGADGIDEVVHGVDVGGEVGQLRHGACRCEESAEQENTHHKEPHHKDGLLHGIAVVGDNESEG